MLLIFLLILLLKSPILVQAQDVIINKFQYNPPLDKNEWIELFNPTNTEIDLNEYQLVDESDTKKLLTGKKIGALGYFIFEDGKSWLNNTGDSIFLKIGDSIIDSVKYVIEGKKVTVNDSVISEEFSDLKGKWIGRDSDKWKLFSDTEGPVAGAINYFDGYKNNLEIVSWGITAATDISGIGSTEINTLESVLSNNSCPNFNYVSIGSSLTDGHCYKYEYVAVDGVGNSTVFTSDAIVKYDLTPPTFAFSEAFRNIKNLKIHFLGEDVESGIAGYKYQLNSLIYDGYTGNNILEIGYTSDPKTICGKAVNWAGSESAENCTDFVVDIVSPKIVRQINPVPGLYKIGDKLTLVLEFDEKIEVIRPNLFQVDKFNFVNKLDNMLNFEYVVRFGDVNNNLEIGVTKILLNDGGIFDVAGNEAELTINNFDNGIIIDGVPPMISIIGDTYMEIPQFSTYIDLGATTNEGELSTINNINTNTGGIYEIIYRSIDDAGNQSEVKRKIKVIDTTAPTISQLSVTSYQLRVDSNEDGYVEWQGKCDSTDKNIISGENIIILKNNGDGIYSDCQIRAWDKWGNVGEWQPLPCFVVDRTAPIISFNNSSQTEIAITANEQLNECVAEKEKIITGDFETENIDGWNGDWVADNIHFASGAWSAKSPILKNEDLVEKSIWQEVTVESNSQLSFWWRVSSEKDWDYLKFFIDGVLIDKISGEFAWQEQKYDLTTGSHTIKFTYSKDYSGESGEDGGWIDKLAISDGGSKIPMIVDNNKATLKLNNLLSGSNKFKIYCTDLFDNKSDVIEKIIIKNIDKVENPIIPLPTPYLIIKSNIIFPTVKPNKIVATKKPGVVLGAISTPTAKITTPSPTSKLKSTLPWEEIKFWGMGLGTLLTTSWIVVLDKKII